MEENFKIASIDTKRFASYDLALYKTHREILTRVVSLQKLWKDAKTLAHKKEIKRLVIDLLNKNFQSMEGTCCFLGAISVPYTLARIRFQLEDTLRNILDKYNIPSPTKKLKEKTKEIIEKAEISFYPDDLDIWWCVNK